MKSNSGFGRFGDHPDGVVGGRVKGVKKLGVRLGNWLTAEQAHALWQAPDRERLRVGGLLLRALSQEGKYCSVFGGASLSEYV